MPPSPSPPPPAPFTLMSGNFDFPHASTSPPPPSRSTGTYESFQQFLARREQERSSAATADGEEIPPRRPRVEPSRRRQQRRSLLSEREPRHTDSLLRRPPPPTASTSNRPRATPSERYLRRSHARLREQLSADMDSTSDMLDSLSDIPVTNAFRAANPSVRPRSPTSELTGSRRQTKRRKLEHDANQPPPYDGFKYGHKGQVVQGRLKMEIMSCDGGEYDKHSAFGLYPIQNVLKNDKSVYCSERSRCNLLLKHIGEMPFTLEKVVIRAPDRGFTAPVQEGLVFVGMSPDDLMSRTTSYNIKYGSPSPSPLPHLSPPAPNSPGDQHLSLREAIEDPYIWENSRQGLQEAMEDQVERLRLHSRRLDMENILRRAHEYRMQRRATAGREDPLVENCEDQEDESYAAVAGVSAPTPPPFTITTESEEESDEEQPSPAIMADRLRRESRWRADSDGDEDDLYSLPPLRRSYAPDSSENYTDRRWRVERHIDPIRATRLQAPSRIESKDQPESEDLIAPHAKFFIAKHKNTITIKFHPAISGKFVLLKLWSPTHDGNIDIESVQFHGFSGPRFFPAVQPR